MLDRGVLHQAEKRADPALPFRKIKDDLQADILFGNLESVISDKGFDQGGPYSFRAPPKMIEGLTLAGFDVLSIANNHSFDWTVDALVDTKERLKSEEIVPVGGGLEAYSPKVVKKKGYKFAFIAHTAIGSPGWASTETIPGVAWYSEEKLKEAIEEVKGEVDLIIFSIHYGTEYQTEPNQNQIDISKGAIDAGVDLVIGHHPHVVQPVEIYKDKIIAYSLGNFIFDQDFSEETMEGLILEVVVSNGKIVGYEKIETKMNSYFQPEIKK